MEKVFEEHASGGKKNQERPILLESIDFCVKNSIDIILVSELSRLGRNALEVVLAIYKSAAEGKPIKLPLTDCASTDFIGRFDK